MILDLSFGALNLILSNNYELVIFMVERGGLPEIGCAKKNKK